MFQYLFKPTWEEMSHGDMELPPTMQKVQHCLHEHWKNCLEFPEAHMYVQCPAKPEVEDDKDLYADPEESLHVAQLVSSIRVPATEDAGSMTGSLVVM